MSITGKILVRSDTELHRSVREVLASDGPLDPKRISNEFHQLEGVFGEQVYSTAVELLFHLDLSPSKAKHHWGKMIRHHRDFKKRAAVNLDFRVSCLDYLTRETKLVRNPTIVETDQYLEIRQDTVTDAMTGLFNYRHFKRTLEHEIARARRYDLALSLIFIDVDHFKKFNDQWGHLVGDKALQMVASVLVNSIRSTDYPCRYGGEEFAIIVPDTRKAGAMLLAERIRNGVEELSLNEADGARVTVSGGVACFPENAKSVEELIDQADRGLYAAKKNGRNQIQLVESDDKRRAPRIPAQLPGVYSIMPKRESQISTKNLSEGGVLFESPGPLAPGSIVHLELQISNVEGPVKCMGRVAHLSENPSNHRYNVGVSILKMSHADRGKYQTFIATQLAA